MPTAPRWQLQTPINAIIFDCDGTLSAIEGIDELASENHVGSAVQFLTETAMSHTGINPDIYRQRLELVLPSKLQVDNLGKKYYEHRVPDAGEVIQLFQRLKKTIYIISAGLSPAVTQFGDYFHVPAANIFAVDVKFDNDGNYLDFDSQSPMTVRDGKRHVVSELKSVNGRVAHIGDGMNDFIAHDISTRFIGYGGIFYRKNIAADCEYYIRAKSLASLLPLILTSEEIKELQPAEKQLYEKGLADIHNKQVEMNHTKDVQP